MTEYPNFTPSSFTYLAGPYSHPEEAVREKRAKAHASVTCALQLAGMSVHSPIAQGHATCRHLPAKFQHDHDFWMGQDLPILRASSFVVCLLLPGWKESKGLAQEMQIVREEGKPFRFVTSEPATAFDDAQVAVSHFRLPGDPAKSWFWPSLPALFEMVQLETPTL